MAETRRVNCRTVAGSFEASSLYTRWVDRVTIVGETVSDFVTGPDTDINENFLREVYLAAPEIPAIGDMHPVYKDCCCESVNVIPARGSTDSPNGIQADVGWLAIRTDAQRNIIHSIQQDNFQQQEIRNFDKNGIKTGVYYNAGAAVAAAASGLFPPYRIADIRVPRTMHGMRLVQYENVAGLYPSDFAQVTGPVFAPKLPCYNKYPFLEYQKNRLLFLGRRIDYQGIPIARVEYDFIINDRGWNKYSAVYTQQNGYVPKDLNNLPTSVWDSATPAPNNPQANEIDGVVLNGIGIFDMLDDADFTEIMPSVAEVSF